jgi:hypothetical protein
MWVVPFRAGQLMASGVVGNGPLELVDDDEALPVDFVGVPVFVGELSVFVGKLPVLEEPIAD